MTKRRPLHPRNLPLSDFKPGVSEAAEAPVVTTTTITPFELSRVYAKGWSAGMTSVIDDTDDVLRQRAEKVNPFTDETARTRWMQGFMEAVRRKCDGPQKKNPRRAAAVSG
jgi:ribosome modulation factor